MDLKDKIAEKTFQYENSLPSLPIPSLEQTLDAYIESCEPLLTEEELAHTRSVCYDFLHGVGPSLQKMLEGKAAEEKNWLEEWWEMFAYLQPRYPSAININWYGVLPGNWGPRNVSQVEAAAVFIQAILKFRKALLKETIPVERMAGQPLSMFTYTRMFNSCVIPGDSCDEMIVYPHEYKHIIVLRNNCIWVMHALDSQGEMLPFDNILSQLASIREEATGLFDLKRSPPVSVLTSHDRTSWAKARNHLRKLDDRNKESIDLIETALFCIALECSSPDTSDEIAQDCLLADGRNRWYDKPFNLIVYENGRGGLNGQHVWADALVVVRLFDFCIKHINSNAASLFPARSITALKKAQQPKQLQWVLDDDAKTAIHTASAAVTKLIRVSQLTTLNFNHYGDAFLKRYKQSPDLFVQLAIQLAYYKMHGSLPAIYETAHTRLFYHGRTETMRSLTKDSAAFCKMMESAGSKPEKWAAMQKGMKTHGVKIKQALMGQGIDRHLMGLLIVSEMSGVHPKPSLFTDKAFQISKRFLISTSNISGGRNASPIWGGFSAMYNEGYGICYALQPDRINFSISAYQVCPDTDVIRLKSCLETALFEMMDLCVDHDALCMSKI